MCRREDVKILTTMILEEQGWPVIWGVPLVRFLPPLQIVHSEHIVLYNPERETTWKSLSFATVGSLGLLLLLEGPAFLCRDISERRCTGPALGQIRAGVGTHSNVSPGEGPHFCRGAPHPPSVLQPFLWRRYLLPLSSSLCVAFYMLEVHKHAPGEFRGESHKQWGLLPPHFQNDYHFGSSLLALCIVATSKKFESILAHSPGKIHGGRSRNSITACSLMLSSVL